MRYLLLGFVCCLLAGCGLHPNKVEQEAACELDARSFAVVHYKDDIDSQNALIASHVELCMRAKGFNLRETQDCKIGLQMAFDAAAQVLRNTNPDCYSSPSWL